MARRQVLVFTPRHRFARASAGFALLLFGVAIAIPASANTGCSVKSRSENIAVVVCPAKSTTKAMRDAGMLACQGLKPCNAWIWDDAAKAPSAAPGRESDFSKADVLGARSIWMNDAKTLTLVEKVK